MTDQAVRIGQLTLKNPVLTASGCFGYGLEYDDFFDVTELGGICTKGLSLHPRLGNAPERICSSSMVAILARTSPLRLLGLNGVSSVMMPSTRP